MEASLSSKVGQIFAQEFMTLPRSTYSTLAALLLPVLLNPTGLFTILGEPKDQEISEVYDKFWSSKALEGSVGKLLTHRRPARWIANSFLVLLSGIKWDSLNITTWRKEIDQASARRVTKIKWTGREAGNGWTGELSCRWLSQLFRRHGCIGVKKNS